MSDGGSNSPGRSDWLTAQTAKYDSQLAKSGRGSPGCTNSNLSPFSILTILNLQRYFNISLLFSTMTFYPSHRKKKLILKTIIFATPTSLYNFQDWAFAHFENVRLLFFVRKKCDWEIHTFLACLLISKFAKSEKKCNCTIAHFLL